MVLLTIVSVRVQSKPLYIFQAVWYEYWELVAYKIIWLEDWKPIKWLEDWKPERAPLYYWVQEHIITDRTQRSGCCSAPLLTLLRMPFVLLKLGSSYQKIESEESTVSKQPHFILFLLNRNCSRKEICISHHPWQRSFGHVVFSFFFSFSFVLKVLYW